MSVSWPCASVSLHVRGVCCGVSMACFPSAGTASEPLAEAPDVCGARVRDGRRAQGVFRNYMLVSKSVLLRTLLPGYLERRAIAEAFAHSCFQESLQTQLLRFFGAFSNTPPMLFPLLSVPKAVTSTTGL